MIKPAPLNELIRDYEFVPQAMIDEPIANLVKRSGLKTEEGLDGFDNYVGVAGWLDEIPFTVMHYSGHPKNTSTLYLPFEIKDVAKITGIISRLALELKFDQSISWQRKDGLVAKRADAKEAVTTQGGSNYWVIGGEFGSMNFHKLVEGSAQVQGPFKTRKEAEDAWKAVSEENRHRAGVRYSIVEEPVKQTG
jgi:hypothetical protein